MKKITFKVDVVLPVLLQVCNVAGNKSAIPILSDVVVKSFKDGSGNTCVMFTASDLDVFLSMKSELVSGDDDFEIAVHAQDFAKALKPLAGYELTIEANGEGTALTGTYENGKFSLPLDNVQEFPKPVAVDATRRGYVIPSNILQQGIQYTEIAASPDNLRPIMAGVHIDFFKDRIVFAALDHAKFAKYANTSVTQEEEGVFGFTMPIRAARIAGQLAGKTDKQLKIAFGEHDVVVSRSDFRLIARLTEGKYPPYDTLLRGENPIKVTLSKDDFANAIKRVLPMGNASSSCVRLDFHDGLLTVSAEDIDFSKSASVDLQCDYDGEGFKICLKGTSVGHCLANLSCEYIVMNMSECSKPAVIVPDVCENDEEFTYMIMPMLLNTL